MGLNQTHDDEVDDSGKRSVSALAADELYIILKTVFKIITGSVLWDVRFLLILP